MKERCFYHQADINIMRNIKKKEYQSTENVDKLKVYKKLGKR